MDDVRAMTCTGHVLQQLLHAVFSLSYGLCVTSTRMLVWKHVRRVRCIAAPAPCACGQGARMGVRCFALQCRHHTAASEMPAHVDDLLIAANGVAFTAPSVRPGVLPRLLREILETRVMVKGALKGAKRDRVLQRRFNARQFALKLIANVTYGYTAAGVRRIHCAHCLNECMMLSTGAPNGACIFFEHTLSTRAKCCSSISSTYVMAST